MSVFTNSGPGAAARAAEYVAATLALLGDRDPMDVLGSTFLEITREIEGVPLRQLAQPEGDGKWSIRDVIQHLEENEIVWAFRVRVTLAQERPQLPAYDQDLWAARLHRTDEAAQAALARFGTLRESTVALLERATPEDLRRTAVHVERGEQTLDQLIRLNGGHDLIHLRQIARIRAAVTHR
jgi:DinB family protein